MELSLFPRDAFAELERLHKIDCGDALDQLVQDYDSKSQALDADISVRRTTWDAELKARERAEKEYDENLKKQRQRETEEYEYKKTIDRKKAQERYDEAQRHHRRSASDGDAS